MHQKLSARKKQAPSPEAALQKAWHALEGKAVLAELQATEAGWSQAESQRRLAEVGRNEVPEAAARSGWQVVAAQLTNLMILVLFGAAGISVLVGEVQDALVILVIIFLNALVGSLQEFRAEKAVQSLRALAAPHGRVLRSGEWKLIPSAELVPGDIVRFEAGDVVTSDVRLLDATDLAVDEAALTGESEPVEKRAEEICAADASVGDRTNMVHRGTLVTRGHASGVIVATGLATELGHIATLLQSAERARTPLQRRLDRFGKQVGLIILGVCAVVFSVGLLRGEDTVLMLLTAVSLGVAAIPEALPAVVSVSLALGARRMIQRHALVRRLPAVETLGSVTYACTDKTGTLTQARMEVASFFLAGEERDALPRDATGAWRELAYAMALNNDAVADRGDPTEVALREAASKAGYEREVLERDHPRIGEVPFHADRRRMSTLHPQESSGSEVAVSYVKGAPEAVLQCCVDDTSAVLARADTMAHEGLRVIAFARREFAKAPGDIDESTLEDELELIGLVGLMDPPRPGALQSVAECITAGVTPVMITGDHPSTAYAIARRLGICGEGANVQTGVDLKNQGDEELRQHVRETRIYARVSPEQKIRIVRALQAQGEFVAMTGDGVNDAPALKAAEIGIAMGKSGTEVAREAADMVLLDDDFSTIVAALREGRRVFDNIRKFVKYTMTSNAGEVWTLLFAPLIGLPLPLLPIQILWINLVTDGLPGLALGIEPAERNVMNRPPRRPDESLFSGGTGWHIVWVGLLIGGLSLAAQAWALGNGSQAWQTVVFTVLTFCQLAHVLAIRSDRDSLLQRGLWSNLPLLAAVVLTVLLQLLVVYTPTLQQLLHTQPLSGTELALCLSVPLLVLFAVELEKGLARRRERS